MSETAVFRLGAGLPSTQTLSMFPGSWGVAADNDVWLATGKILTVSIALFPMLTSVTPVYVRVYDYLIEASQIIRRGGVSPLQAGKAQLDATAFTAGRAWTHPSLGAVTTDVYHQAAAIPADLAGLREVWSGVAAEQSNNAATGFVTVGNEVLLRINHECPHGMMVQVENRSGIAITGSATAPSVVCTVNYEPWVTGRQRHRTRTLPTRAAAMG